MSSPSATLPPSPVFSAPLVCLRARVSPSYLRISVLPLTAHPRTPWDIARLRFFHHDWSPEYRDAPSPPPTLGARIHPHRGQGVWCARREAHAPTRVTSRAARGNCPARQVDRLLHVRRSSSSPRIVQLTRLQSDMTSCPIWRKCFCPAYSIDLIICTPHESFGSGPELLATGDKNNFWSILTDAARCVSARYPSPHPLSPSCPRAHSSCLAQDLCAFRQLSMDRRVPAPLSSGSRAHERTPLALRNPRPGAHRARLLFARPLPLPRAHIPSHPHLPLDLNLPFHAPQNHEDQSTGASPPLKQLADDGILAMVAGADTVASALTSLFACLLAHPRVYARLQKEVDACFPPGEDPLDASVHREMTYLDAVV